MDELRTSVLETVKKRFNSPVFGFIFLSWIAFNWDIILFVLLSKKSIEERIHIVRTIPNDILPNIHYLWPIIVGLVLAIGNPYGRLLFNYLHQWAKQKEWRNAFHQEVLILQQKIGLAEKKVEADNVEELERERFKTRLQEEKDKQENLAAHMENMTKQKNYLSLELEEINNKVNAYKIAYERILNKTSHASKIISQFYKLDSSVSMKDIKESLEKEITPEDLKVLNDISNDYKKYKMRQQIPS